MFVNPVRLESKATPSMKRIYKGYREINEPLVDNTRKLSKVLVALGVIMTAGIGIGMAATKRNAKQAEKIIVQAGNDISDVASSSKTAAKAIEVVQEVTENLQNKVSGTIQEVAEDTQNKVAVKVTETVDVKPEKIQDTLEDAFEEFQKSINETSQNATEKTKKASADLFEDFEFTIEKKSDDRAVREIRERMSNEFSEKVAQATDEYQYRINNGLRLSDRVKALKDSGAEREANIAVSKMRSLQLNTLSNNQINALSDETLEHLLFSPAHAKGKLRNMKFLKSLTPEQLIRIQTDKHRLYALYEVIESDTKGYGLDCMINSLRNF